MSKYRCARVASNDESHAEWPMGNPCFAGNPVSVRATTDSGFEPPNAGVFLLWLVRNSPCRRFGFPRGSVARISPQKSPRRFVGSSGSNGFSSKRRPSAHSLRSQPRLAWSWLSYWQPSSSVARASTKSSTYPQPPERGESSCARFFSGFHLQNLHLYRKAVSQGRTSPAPLLP